MKESAGSTAPIVHALSRKEFYPHRPEEVEVRQTHISHVFLSGPIVYKIKKPVRFSFLDYSTLDKRRHFCKEEVRLNRRLAPDVYLDVVPILENEGRFVLGDGVTEHSGKKVEFAVKMRRLPEAQMLATLIRNGQVGTEAMDRVAAKLVAFHAGGDRECKRLRRSRSDLAEVVRELARNRTVRRAHHRRAAAPSDQGFQRRVLPRA